MSRIVALFEGRLVVMHSAKRPDLGGLSSWLLLYFEVSLILASIVAWGFFESDQLGDIGDTVEFECPACHRKFDLVIAKYGIHPCPECPEPILTPLRIVRKGTSPETKR